MIWSVAAQYCVRQNAHAFLWLWGLFLILASGALALRRSRRRSAAVLLFFAVCTVLLGVVIFAACSAYAPLSMGLPPSRSAIDETMLMCLGKDAFETAILWTIVVAACSASLGSVTWGRFRSKSAASRAVAYVGAALLLLVAATFVLLWMFGFSLCSTQWVF